MKIHLKDATELMAKIMLEPVSCKTAKKVPDQLLVCGIGDL